MRPKGVVVTRPDKELVVGSLVAETKQLLKAKADHLSADRERRAAIPVPNWKCYPQAFAGRVDDKGNWLPGVSRRLPDCHVCDGTLHKNENHVCEGFTPKYVEHDEAWEERQEAHRAEIREARLNGTVFDEDWCDEDAPEEDYCEGDDDGYDCD
jgi:hypothetical protein